MALDSFGDVETALTRSEYYAGRNGASNGASNGAQPERRCAGCDTSLEGRIASTRWCSTACAKRFRRRNGESTATDVAVPDRIMNDEPASLTVGEAADGLVELVNSVVSAHDFVAITVEYANGWNCTLAHASYNEA